MSDTQTDNVLRAMLTENTGRHFLDSGGAYGRAWEQNQGKDFDAQPDANLRFTMRGTEEEPELDVEFSLNVYQWLRERVTYDATLQGMFDAFAELEEYADTPYLQLMEAFIGHMRARGYDVSGIYHEGEPLTVNTYNGEDALTQTLQYVYMSVKSPDENWEDDSPNPALDGEYLLLQIHGGCDVRGGYTAPKCFTCSIDEYSILDNARGALFCERNHNHHWYTENAGYSWHDETYPRVPGSPRELGEWDVRAVETQPEEPAQQPTLPDMTPRVDIVGYVGVDDDHNGYCPYCGGKLSGGAY